MAFPGMAPSGGFPETFGHGIDLAALILLVFCAVRGGIRGLTGEVARVAGLLAALAAGYWTSGLWGGVALRCFPEGANAYGRGLVVVAGLVVAAILAAQLVRWVVDRFLRLLLDQPANAVLGVVAGSLRAALLLLAFFLVASLVAYGSVGRVLFEGSVSGRVALPAVQSLRGQLSRLDPAWAFRAGR